MVLLDQRLRDIIDRLSDAFELGLASKPVWKSTQINPEVMEKMLRQTVHGKFYIDASTWKLDQNKPENVRLRAADQVEQHNIGCDTHLLASFMREA